MKSLSKYLLCLCLCLCFPIQSLAAAYPTQPVKVIVSGGPGGLLDLAMRAACSMLAAELGQPFLVSNVGGGDGNVAINTMFAAPQDGYTILAATSPQITYNAITQKVKYKFEDFRMLGTLGEQRIGIITQPDRPWNNLKDAFEWAKKENKPLITGVMNAEDREIITKIAKIEGVNISPVPQNGGAPALTAVLGGHVDIAAIGLLFVESALAGKVKALACESTKRFTKLPDVPTLRELGYDISQETYFLLLGSNNMPAEVIKTLETAMAKIGNTPEYKEQVYVRLGMEQTAPDAESTRQAVQRVYESTMKNYGNN